MTTGRGAGLALILMTGLAALSHGQDPSIENLPQLTPGRVRAQNALWIETPLTSQFKSSNVVVVADIKGPAVITMIHFAMPATLKLNRDLLLRMYWDGEKSPSVETPLVDFFCDPAGLRESVDTALVNKRRGFNAYFPMPFRRSARIELVYDGVLTPGAELWKAMPCYSYVMYRTLKRLPRGTGYFHASWRQEALLLGKKEYLALEAQGQGKFVGWNVTVRRPGRGNYPVDENEKFFIDGESEPSVEFQGLEDSFGFSWGFPQSESEFPFTGYFPFYKGAAAYRFFAQDAISFRKSLRVTIGFGVNEEPRFYSDFSRPGSTLQFSSTVYWYQTEPHAPLPAIPKGVARAPLPEEAYWPGKEALPVASDLRKRGVKARIHCGRPEKELVFAEPGYQALAKKGFAWDGWDGPVYHARASGEEVEIELRLPDRVPGTVRVFISDPDNFDGGRTEKVVIAGDDLGPFDHFQNGRWIEHHLNAEQTAGGKVLVQAVNARKSSNAVISIVEWVEN